MVVAWAKVVSPVLLVDKCPIRMYIYLIKKYMICTYSRYEGSYIMIKRKRLRIATLALISVMIFAGCGATKETTEKTAEKTYNYSKEYQTAAEHLEECILEDKTYTSLKDALTSYENKDLKKLSKKDAKALKSTMEDIEEYYEASADTIQDALVQIGQVYPTEDGFYDETFKASTTALFEELNALLDKGHYKEAADKLNEITTAYTAYVESKGETVSADISVDASKTASAKDAIASSKASSKSNAGANASASVGSNASASAGASANAGNSGNTNNASSSGTTATAGNTGNTSNTTNAGATTGNKNNTSSGNINASNNNNNTSTRIPYSWTCPECGAVITGYKGEDDNVNQHDRMHSTEEANAFKYVTDADNAYGAWCDSPECDATIPYDTWLDTHGYSSSLYHQYCQKYGWE